MKIILQLPQVKRKKPVRPKRCPYCQGETFQRWGVEKRRIEDVKVRHVEVVRYRCTRCRRTFRDYPEGVGNGRHSERLKKLSVILWSLGLSYRRVAGVLRIFGLRLSHMSGWRHVQAEGEKLMGELKWKSVRVVGVDGAWVGGKGVMVAVDLGDGSLLEVAEVDEKDSRALFTWLKRLKEMHDIGAIVSDDLAIYKQLTDELEIGHQVCQFHVRRWVKHALKGLQAELDPAWQGVLEKVEEILRDLPLHGDRLLHRLWKSLPGRSTPPEGKRTPLEKLRDLILRLSRDWQRYVAFYADVGIPWTNNRTEQMIGRLKSRAQQARRYKTTAGLLRGSTVACQFWA